MKILWLTWKDLKHPQAGGAERVNEELAQRLAQDGHEVIILTAGFPGCVREETVDSCHPGIPRKGDIRDPELKGYKVVRVGNRWTVYYQAYRYYRKHLRGWADLAIDEVNTMPFFAKFYVKEKNILFVHQLCREIWFYQMFFPLNLIGYILEPLYLGALSDRKVITVSESTKRDLMRFRFKEENITIISEGIDLEPVEDIGGIEKYEHPTLLSFGSVRRMKRTDHIIRAFILAKEKMPDLELIVAGDYDNPYGKKVFRLAQESKYAKSIKFLGKVDRDQKIELMQKSHVLLAASVKEGWGLIVTEANSQGTPAIVYDVDGLRDSVRNGETGLICEKNDSTIMARKIIGLLQNKESREELSNRARHWCDDINFDNSYMDFIDNLI